jgi:hypothetical protein
MGKWIAEIIIIRYLSTNINVQPKAENRSK